MPGPCLDPGEVEMAETSLVEDPSVLLGIPAPRRYVEEDGPEWRELDYLVQAEINIFAGCFLTFLFRSEVRHQHFSCSFNNMTGIFIQARLSQTR